MKIVQQAYAGTLESSDALVRIAPTTQGHLTVYIESTVFKQFGDAIESLIRDTLEKMSITEAIVTVDDKGALDCVLRARVQAAAMRAANNEAIYWSQLS